MRCLALLLALPCFFPALPAEARHLEESFHESVPSPAADEPLNVYRSTMSGRPAASVRDIPARVYVPNSDTTTVTVIDPFTFTVLDHLRVGSIPHHVTPSADLRRLYVNNEGSSSLSVINPRTFRVEETVSVPYPYNLYFTPDATKAVVVVERLRRLDFRDPSNWELIRSVDIPWAGPDHLDFSADGRFLMVSTEWTGHLVKVDIETMAVVGAVNVGSLPIDVRLSPDGSVFFVTNQGRNGVSVVDPVAMKEVAFIPTARGAHGLQISRDTKHLYVSNRLAGSISVIEIATRRVAATWNVGGSPDMLQVNPEGTQLWTAGRLDGWVYVIDTGTGGMIKKIYSGPAAHGLTYFPNAGTTNTGHNGVYR
jgi:YVTN family beta-propeller protein